MCNILISKVTEIRSSPLHGKGLFATQDIKKGTVLIDDAESFGFCVHMNDADFIYPQSYSTAAFKDSFEQYLLRDTCNVRLLDDPLMKVIEDIPKGKEITRRYGLQKWIQWLIFDIHGVNALGNYFFDVLDREIFIKYKEFLLKMVNCNINNLSLAMEPFEYEIKVLESDPKQSKTLFQHIRNTFKVVKKTNLD
ncbi:Hypothetical protein HVR_LOCUS366 [uncultured virus]|nr:Hypothetical protein HVR_LOCUS366 [uncultured virus]